MGAIFSKIGAAILQKLLVYGGKFLMDLLTGWYEKLRRKKAQTKADEKLGEKIDTKAPRAERQPVEEDYINS